MKCQQCEKPATFHITELTGTQPQEHHLCENCAKVYLEENEPQAAPVTDSLANVLSKQLKMGQAAEELSKLDQRACPVCGITFLEFRNKGRLGCPHDYVFFERELTPLILNIHGDAKHVGKRPARGNHGTDDQSEVIRLRRDLELAIKQEDYEEAARLRDKLRDRSR